uniref:legumain n=1 Tax=Cicer arietinum TaxID=3827 RepID=A0A1S3E1A2_CICAR|nr:vacuolar-processing enzyme-like isoform X2 [Cicer arietinum]
MKGSMSYWVTLIVIVWMNVTLKKTKGVQSIKNQLSQFVEEKEVGGTKWALLVAGSNGYANYRHQADICHAYQILKKGGLKDENIIVMMYNDIAYNEENPMPGIIYNNPNGPDVYFGVPHDFTYINVNANNFYAVLSGNKSALTGVDHVKVLNTKSNDTIFIYMSGHAMPDSGQIWGDDLVNALKKKHDALAYKKMVIYIESCYSGSMFEGILPNNINIYATTASNAHEDSYGFYCPDYSSNSPPFFTTCLGDLYSISWMEDSDKSNRTNETLHQQYLNVRNRTAKSDPEAMSHVMVYGDLVLGNDSLATYLGVGPDGGNDNYNFNTSSSHEYSYQQFNMTTRLVSQKDVSLLHLKLKMEKAPDGSKDKLKAQIELDVEIAHRKNVDRNVHFIWDLMFGEDTNSTMMTRIRSASQPVIDDWDCLKMILKTYEHHCGILSPYGMKYSRAFINVCNAGISEKQIIDATSQACPKKNNFS